MATTILGDFTRATSIGCQTTWRQGAARFMDQTIEVEFKFNMYIIGRPQLLTTRREYVQFVRRNTVTICSSLEERPRLNKLIELTRVSFARFCGFEQTHVGDPKRTIFTNSLFREGGYIDMFRPRIMKVSLQTSFSIALLLLLGTFAHGQVFAESDRELVFHTNEEGKFQLETATPGAGTIAYNTTVGTVHIDTSTTVPASPDFATPLDSHAIVVNPILNFTSAPVSAVYQADPAVTGHPVVTGFNGGNTVLEIVAVTSGTATLDKVEGLDELASGTYYISDGTGVPANPGSAGDIVVFNADVGSNTGDTRSYTVEITYANSTVDNLAASSPSPAAMKTADNGFDYPLGDSGLLLRYGGVNEGGNDGIVGGANAADDTYEPNQTVAPTLWGTPTEPGVHTLTYAASAGGTGAGQLTYEVLVLNRNVWRTDSASVSLRENTTDLTGLNSVLAGDRTDDGTAAGGRAISYSVDNPTFAVAADASKNPLLSVAEGASIDYEGSGGVVEAQICASGDHVDGNQCYMLTINVLPMNEAPSGAVDMIGEVYLLQDDPLPSSILLTDLFTDPEGDSLIMRIDGDMTMSSEGGFDVTADIIGDTVLSFSKSGTPTMNGNHSYSFGIVATDGELDSDPVPYVIHIKVGANTSPIWRGGATSVTWTVEENVGGVIGTLEAIDVDGDSVSYYLDTPWAGAVIGISGGAVWTTGYNFEAGSQWSFNAYAKDNFGGETPPVNITVVVTNVDEPPVISGIPTQRVYKDVASVVDVAAYASDPEGDAISFTCVSADTSIVTVNTSCTDGAVINAMKAGSTSVRVIASNAGGSSEPAVFNVVAKGSSDNNPPAFANGVEAVAFSVNEDMAPGTVGTPIGVSDPDEGDNIILSTIPADSKFAVSNVDGNAVISLSAANLDHETEPSVHFIVKADDEWEGRDYLRVTINVADVNEPPTRTAMAMDDVSVVENSSMEVDVSMLFADEDEIDSGRLQITALVANPFVAEVMVNAQNTAIISGGEPGMTDVTLIARDSAGHQVTETFSVTVTSNNVPMVANAIADMEIGVSEIVNIDLAGVFSDADGGDVIVMGVESSNEDAVLAVLTRNNTRLAVIGAAEGMADVTVTAADSSHSYVSDTFMVTVSADSSGSAPRVARELSDVTVTADVAELLEIGDVFEGESLSYSTLNSDPSIATMSIDGDQLSIMGHDVGSTQVSLIATNDMGRSSIAMFVVLVETMPTAVGTLPAVVLEVGADSYLVDFGTAFEDRDGDELSYDVSITDAAFIDYQVADTMLWLTALSRGSSDVTITASDPAGRSATQSFALTVGDNQIRAIAEQSLAGFGRAMLTSVTDAVGDRITSDTKSSDMSFKSWVQSLAKRYTTPLQNGPQASDVLNSVSNPLDSLAPRSFAFGFGDGGQGSWSVWSQTDSQGIDGEAYKVDTNSIYLGLDMQATDKLTVGLAVSRNSGEGSFEFGSAMRNMQNDLTIVIPYASYAPTAKSQVWTLAGLGRGTTDVRGGLDSDSSELSMRLLSVGGRHELATSGRWSLAVRGDYATADLTTASGADLSSDLNASVNRTRAGFEGSMKFNTSRGTVTPFADVGLRKDGGTDISGTGLEVAGGVRLALKTFTLEAKGRTLAMHSAQSYREDGFSLKATMNPSGDGSGLSFSVTPRWGANASGTDAIFADSTELVRSVYGNASDSQAVSARVGYGLRVSNEDFLVTPYVDYDQGGLMSRTKMLVGTTVTSSRFTNLKLNLAAGSEQEQLTGESGAVAGIEATLRF